MTGEELMRDGFDDFLEGALRGRAELTAGIDVAGEAMARGRAYQANDARLARLARITLWARVATFAAAALIAVTVAVGYRFLPAASAATETVADTTTSSSTFDLTTVGVAAFVVTLIVVALATLFTTERPQVRLSL